MRIAEMGKRECSAVCGRCMFDDYDAIADVPYAFFTPYIYAAYGNGTKVINTVRRACQPPCYSWLSHKGRYSRALTQGVSHVGCSYKG